MQFLYVVGLIMMLGIVGGQLSKEKARDVASESDGVAKQFTMWHRAAYDRCSKAACAGGTVSTADIIQYLPEPMRGLQNSPYTRGWFTTRYDPTTKLLVSHMTTTFKRTEQVSFGTIATALYNDSMMGQTSSAGVWSGTEIQALRPAPVDSAVTDGKLPFLTIPPNFMGVTIPVGSPIVASLASFP